MGDSVLAALRVLGKCRKITFRSSAAFRRAANTGIELRQAVRDGVESPDQDPEFDVRADQVLRGLRLQRDLEQQHALPHKRYLLKTVGLAASSDKFQPHQIMEMETIAQSRNSAMHRRWRSPSPTPVWRRVAPATPSKEPKRILELHVLLPKGLPLVSLGAMSERHDDDRDELDSQPDGDHD